MSLDATGLRPAVFLHRDGVLVEPRVAGAERPRLVPAAAHTVLALRRGGYACIILAAADVPRSFDDRVCEAFAAEGVVFDAVRRYPVVLTRAGMASEAVVATAMSATAADLKLDLARSWRVDAHSADVAGGAGVPGALRVCVAAGHRTGNHHHPSVTACGDFAGLLTSLGSTCVARREASA
jgi:hypothetical protein